MARQNLPTAQRRDMTVETVVDLAATNNPAEITTGQIAEHMGLSQGALFRHFPTKDAVWGAVMVWTADQLTQRLDRALAKEASPLSALEAMFMAHVGFVAARPGVPKILFGELQRTGELFQSFGIAMAVGIFCIYAVLVLLFHDFLQPATILSALPLALGGAIIALWVSHQAFSMPAVIGVLMLMGIVTKNSILLVEYAVMARRGQGMTRLEALVDACHKRARPIVMTTVAMGAGMLPNALGLGAEPSFRQPMAIVVIGGLMTSTALSLLVVPVVFTYVDDLLQWLRRRLPGSLYAK